MTLKISKILQFLHYFPKNTPLRTYTTRVFNRTMKKNQRDWAAKLENSEKFQYLKEEMAYRVADRVYDLTDFMPICLDVGCGFGRIAPHVFADSVSFLVETEMSEFMLEKALVSEEVPTEKVACDEELLPLRENSVDLIVTSGSVHWINDLPAFFSRCFSCLRPDGALIGSMLAGQTLYQLRCSLQLAEMERLGGVASHISPFTRSEDLAALLDQAGFKLTTLDTDKLDVNYPNPYVLLHDLQGMAESNCAYLGANHIRRDVLLAAGAVYTEMYAGNDGQSGLLYPATFEILNFIGWKPGPKLPKPVQRGSQTASFKDIAKFTEQGFEN